MTTVTPRFPSFIGSGSTLGRDAELVGAFLRIQQIRMGQRLAFSTDIPLELRTHPVPPMMLLTLVENAIKHGLNPSPFGGLVRVTARCEGDRLALSVADTGVGFGSIQLSTKLARETVRLPTQSSSPPDNVQLSTKLARDEQHEVP
jgi:sensor histidine kinase YesM